MSLHHGPTDFYQASLSFCLEVKLTSKAADRHAVHASLQIKDIYAHPHLTSSDSVNAEKCIIPWWY